jgi:hypothetical protein
MGSFPQLAPAGRCPHCAGQFDAMKSLGMTWFSDKSSRWVALAGCLLVVLGAKLWLIGTFGSAVPFWDQWDSEGALLYRPYLTGTLSPARLLEHHNEHRILFTRLFGLGLLTLSGEWNPLLEMIGGALVHTATLGVLIVVLARQLDTGGRTALALFCMGVHAMPFGWENTLWGFQIQFYLLLLFGAAAIALLFDAPAFSARWWLGTLLAIASFFNTVSGALTLVAAIAVAGGQVALRQRRGSREFAALALHAALVAVMLADIPRLAHHSELVSHSFMQSFTALITAAGWPLITHDWLVRFRILAVLALNAPLLLVAASVLWRRPGIDDRRWCLLGLGAWVALQIAALAYGRAGGVWASRYFDIFTVGLLVNGACALALWRMSARNAVGIATTLWFAMALTGLAQKANGPLPQELARRSAETRSQAANVKNFMVTGDFAHLRDKPPMHIPYPDAARLRDALSDPVIRGILPLAISGDAKQIRVVYTTLRYGHVLIPIGFALLLIGIAGARRPDGEAAVR